MFNVNNGHALHFFTSAKTRGKTRPNKLQSHLYKNSLLWGLLLICLYLGMYQHGSIRTPHAHKCIMAQYNLRVVWQCNNMSKHFCGILQLLCMTSPCSIGLHNMEWSPLEYYCTNHHIVVYVASMGSQYGNTGTQAVCQA